MVLSVYSSTSCTAAVILQPIRNMNGCGMYSIVERYANDVPLSSTAAVCAVSDSAVAANVLLHCGEVSMQKLQTNKELALRQS